MTVPSNSPPLRQSSERSRYVVHSQKLIFRDLSTSINQSIGVFCIASGTLLQALGQHGLDYAAKSMASQALRHSGMGPVASSVTIG